MIYRAQSLALTQALRELPREMAGDLPLVAIDSDLSLFPDGYSTWHWHESFEFCIVTSGAMELGTQRRLLRLRAGEGYFVNANVLHSNRAVPGPEPVRIHVLQFGANLLGGGERARRRYAQPVADCAALDALPLSPDNPTERELLDALRAAFAAAEGEPPSWELRAAERLTHAWRLLFERAAPTLRDTPATARDDSSRIKEMLSYLHAHIAEPITVAGIAAAAGLSERECHRCFRQTLGISPIPYLTRLRVDAAARELSSTARSITEIAADCGFNSPAYFCSVFHKLMGRSPREFRKNPERADN